MPTESKQKPSYPPLKCEQLEERSVLTVHVGPAGVVSTDAVHAHLASTVTDFALLPPATQVPTAGANLPATPPSGTVASTTSNATSATNGSSAASGSSVPGSANNSASSSGAAANGGPLITSGGSPIIMFAPGSLAIPNAPFGAPSSTLSLMTASVSSSSAVESLTNALPSVSTVVSLPVTSTSVDASTTLSLQNLPALGTSEEPTLTTFIAPVTTTSSVSSTNQTPSLITTEKAGVPSNPATLLTHTSTTTSTSSATIPFVVHSDIVQPVDDEAFDSSSANSSN